jgi:transposase
MRVASPIVLNPEQKQELEQCARARSLSARLVERARIVLLAAAGKQDKEVAEDLGITAHKAARWRQRFLAKGMAGLEKDAPRSGRTPSISPAKVKQVIHKTTQEKPAQAAHWSTRTMAAAVGLSAATVRRIWRKHGLKPHRMETFKVSTDPHFVEKLENIVGLYLNPPEHALFGRCNPANGQSSQ